MQYEQLSGIADNLYYSNFVMQINIINIARQFYNYHINPSNTSLLNDINVDELFANMDSKVEKELFVAIMTKYGNHFDKKEIPEEIQKLVKKYNGNWETLAVNVYENTMFNNPKAIKDFIRKPNAKRLSSDPAFIIYEALFGQIAAVAPTYRYSTTKIAEYDHIFVKGLREFYAETQPDKVLYPDANSTMRLTYGPVKSYVSQEGKVYNYYTTSNDFLKKYIPGDYEFDAPKDFIDLLQRNSFGRYSNENDELQLCFLSKTDFTGGASGSPVINSKGELVGIAFDGNWEAMSSDIMFEPKLHRTICLDIRYALFIIDKYAGAKNIIDELDIKQ